MENLIKLGRIFYGIGVAGLVTLHFFFSGFRPVFVPETSNHILTSPPLIYIFSIAIIALCIFMLVNFKAKASALIVGLLFLILFLVFHAPNHIVNNLTNVGAWTNALKILALSGGAFVMADSYHSEKLTSNPFFDFLEKIMPYGGVFFSIMMIVFGIDHILYAQGVATLVPSWIPFSLFWTYFAAVALIGTGVCIIFKIKVKMVGILAGIMLFIWFLILHLPRAFSMPALADNGNEWSSVFQSLAFSGIAFVLALKRRG